MQTLPKPFVPSPLNSPLVTTSSLIPQSVVSRFAPPQIQYVQAPQQVRTVYVEAPPTEIIEQVSSNTTSDSNLISTTSSANGNGANRTNGNFDSTCKEFATILNGTSQIINNTCLVFKPRPLTISIDGISSSSPLVGHAAFSFEKLSNGTSLNLGETNILASEIPKFLTSINNTNNNTIRSSFLGSRWNNTQVDNGNGLYYTNWQSKENPLDFARKTKAAWNSAFSDKI